MSAMTNHSTTTEPSDGRLSRSESVRARCLAPGRHRRWTAAWMTGALAIGGLAMTTPLAGPSGAAGRTDHESVPCSNDITAPGRQFLLTAKDGYISTPDGNAVYMWGYAYGNRSFQLPGPVLCVNEGDEVVITLKNELPQVATSLQFSGIEGVRADGRPAQPQFDGTGVLTSLTDSVAATRSISYAFVAAHPGTYLYQSGTDPDLQVQMGLYGALIVRPIQVDAAGPATGNTAWAYDRIVTPAVPAVGTVPAVPAVYAREMTSVYDKTHEYMLLLSEIDPDLHAAAEEAVTAGQAFRSQDYRAPYKARYFLINGRSFPDTIAPNNASWLPNQPYSALTVIEPYSLANPLPSLLRYLSVGKEAYPFHPHSNHERVIAKDGRILSDGTTDLSEEHFAVVVSPGSTQDATFVWTNVEGYSLTNPVPVPVPLIANLTDGSYWDGTPYLGSKAKLNPGVNSANQCGEYYHVAHSHNLTQATNYGASFGGMLTLIRVNPPSPNSCHQ